MRFACASPFGGSSLYVQTLWGGMLMTETWESEKGHGIIKLTKAKGGWRILHKHRGTASYFRKDKQAARRLGQRLARGQYETAHWIFIEEEEE